MNKLWKPVMAIVVTVALIGSCNMGFNGTSEEQSSGGTDQPAPAPSLPTEPSDPNMSLLHIGVPTISASLMEALDATYTPSGGGISGSALLFASGVTFTLEYPEASGIADIVWTVNSLNYSYVSAGEEVGPLAYSAQEVNPGTGMVLHAQVFGGDPLVTEPVVSGSSAPFSVGPGSTATVNITATPYNPVVLNTTTASESVSVKRLPFTPSENPAYVDEETTPDEMPFNVVFNDLGGERWYHVQPSSTTASYKFARIRVSPTGGDVIMFPFEADGTRTPLWDGFGYDFNLSIMEYVTGNTGALPSNSRAGIMVPMYSVDTSPVWDELFVGVVPLGVSAGNTSIDVVYDELDYSGLTPPSADLTNPVSGTPVVLEFTVPASSFLDPQWDDVDNEFWMQEHFYELENNVNTMASDGLNEIEVTIEFDVLEDWMYMDLLYPMGGNLADSVPENNEYPELGLYWEGADDAATPYRAAFVPTGVSITEEVDRDVVTITYDVDPTALPEAPVSLDPATVRYKFAVGSDLPGNGYSIVWVNNSPGYVSGSID